MTDRQNKHDQEPMDDPFFLDEADLSDDELEAEEPARHKSSSTRRKSMNMDMRHRIEERLEQRRLMKELNEYEFFDLDDENALH